MSERQEDEAARAADAMQIPHVPGLDPRGTGMPRQRDMPRAPAPETDEKAAKDDSARHDGSAADDESADRSSPPGEGDAPLGGTEITEEHLTADTAVERDALKSLDPDDSPA